MTEEAKTGSVGPSVEPTTKLSNHVMEGRERYVARALISQAEAI